MDKEGWGDPDEDVDDEVPSSHNTPISARQASLCTLAGDVKHLMANTVTGRRLGQAMHHLFELLRCDSNDARRERRPAQRKPTPLRETRNHGTTNEEKGDSLPTPMHPDWNTRTDRGEHVLLLGSPPPHVLLLLRGVKKEEWSPNENRETTRLPGKG